MKYKNIIVVILILFIVAVNSVTVFWLVRDESEPAQSNEKNDVKAEENVNMQTLLFGSPDSITVVCEGESYQVQEKKYEKVLGNIENCHKYIESFTNIGAFTANEEFYIQLDYDKPHGFVHVGYEYDVTSIKINLYNGAGDMLLQTEDGSVALGYLNITAELIESVR